MRVQFSHRRIAFDEGGGVHLMDCSVRTRNHGSKFEDYESLPEKANPLLLEQHRTLRTELDGNSNQQ
jgi:hypothetical protein